MAEKCAGCTNKYKYFERPSICPKCRRGFCQTCLPYKGKKVKKTQPQIATEMCVYCSKQRSVNRVEEEDILSNFQERFYKHAHTEPPIQSRLRLDLVMGTASANSSPQLEPKVVQLSEEDKILEERLRKLRESHEKTTPSYSEEELRDKLEHLRDDGSNKVYGDGGVGEKNNGNVSGGGDYSGGGKTQTEQSDQLVEKATDEVRLDDQLRAGNNITEDELRRRLQFLKGGESSSSSVGDKAQASQVKLDIKTLVDDMDDSFVSEDSPEKLLNDLIAFQSKVSKNVVAEVDSADVQYMLEKAQKLAKQEGVSNIVESEGGNDDPLPHIVYPLMPDGEGDENKKTVSPEDEAEIAKAIQEGLDAVQIEHEKKSKEMDYIKQTSEQLARLQAEEKDMVISDDEVVRSKPKPKPGSHLDFSWAHFSGHSTPSSQDRSGRDLPNPARDEFNEEVQDLIARTLEEAELDERLEASGLKYQTEDTSTQNKMIDSGNSASGGGEVAASFPPLQAAVPRIVYSTDDLPWCCICNDDATIHCYDCDDDLYCQRCFSDGHKQFGLFDHHYEIFETPRK